jgi:hypothetical protein
MQLIQHKQARLKVLGLEKSLDLVRTKDGARAWVTKWGANMVRDWLSFSFEIH